MSILPHHINTSLFYIFVLLFILQQAVDTLVNYETVKMFGMEAEESANYEELQKKFQDEYIWFRVTLNSLNFGQSIIQTVGLGAAMIFAAKAASQGQLTPGDFVLVNSYVLQLFQPLFVSTQHEALPIAQEELFFADHCMHIILYSMNSFWDLRTGLSLRRRRMSRNASI